MKKLLLLLIATFSLSGYSQVDFSGEATLQGLYNQGERLPFWMYHNTRGRISENTNIAGWVNGRMNYEIGYDGNLELGAGVLFRDGDKDNFIIDEVYAHFETSQFYITAGIKQQKLLYNGLSATNRSILWSLNARPLPGIQIGTNGPLFPFDPDNAGGFGFEGSWNEYQMEKDRYVSNARLHHKNLLFVYKSASNFQIKAGLQHFVQWGGTSPTRGKQPESVKDYFRIITASGGGGDAFITEQTNALGNHLGGYEVYFKKWFRDFSVELLYNHIFEDGSGTKLRNTPDGRYGVYLETKDQDQIINSVIYELYYTQHQSHSYPTLDGADNYFGNSTYRSGWTYENRILGAPFFTPDPDGGILNNKFTAHHLGIGGQVSNYFVSYPYRLLMSFARNDGRYTQRFRPKQNVAYVFSEVGLLRTWIHLDLQFGAEYNTFTKPMYGFGVQVRKQF